MNQFGERFILHGKVDKGNRANSSSLVGKESYIYIYDNNDVAHVQRHEIHHVFFMNQRKRSMEQKRMQELVDIRNTETPLEFYRDNSIEAETNSSLLTQRW